MNIFLPQILRSAIKREKREGIKITMEINFELEREKLKEAAAPLVNYLRKRQTPETTAIVTGAGVEIVSTDIHIPFEENWD